MVEGKNEAETLAKLVDSFGIDAFVIHAIALASRTLAIAKSNRDGPGYQWMIPTGFSLRFRRGTNYNVEYARLEHTLLNDAMGKYVRPFYNVQAIFLDDRTALPVYVAMMQCSELTHAMVALKQKGIVSEFSMNDAAFYSVTSDDLRAAGCASLHEYEGFPKYLAIGRQYRPNSNGKITSHFLLFDKERAAYEEASATLVDSF